MGKIFLTALVALMSIGFTSCGDHDDEPLSIPPTSYDTGGDENEKQIVKPTFKKDLSKGIFDGVKFICRFDMGGDEYDNVDCVVNWIALNSKPLSTPTHEEVDRGYSDNMRNYYENESVPTTKVFECEHAGRKTHGYVYYYFECTNSAGTTTTPVQYLYVRQNY